MEIGAFVKYLKDQRSIFVAIVVLGITSIVMGASEISPAKITALGVVLVFALVMVLVHFRLEQKRRKGTARIITKQDYGELLKEWNASGNGEVLLFNIELQTFSSRETMERTWGGIAQLEKIRKVILLLPENKARRWGRIVTEQFDGFFKNESNRKFHMCEFGFKEKDEWQTDLRNIAFALYSLSDESGKGAIHSKIVVFVLSQPFSKLKQPFIPGDSMWWDYHHILEFSDDEEIAAEAEKAK